MLDAKTIGERLKALRGNKTREEVAYDMQLSFAALYSYEQGLRIPRDNIKVKFAEYYNVSVQSIFFNK